MKKTDDLDNLIQSLSKTEKRYFKLFASRNMVGGDSNYITLFDLLDKQRNGVTGSKNGTAYERLARQFRVYKHRLYNQLLKSLNAYYSGGSVDSILRELIGQAEVLFNKKLYDAANKTLSKAKELAYRFEKFPQALEIIRWEKKIIGADTLYKGMSSEYLAAVYKEEKALLHKIGEINEYWKGPIDLFLLYNKTGIARFEQDRRAFDAIMDTELLKKEETALSYESRRYFYASHIFYYFCVADFKASGEWSKKLVSLMEAHPGQIEDDPEAYFNTLFNLLYALKGSGSYREFLDAMPKIRAMYIKLKPRVTASVYSLLVLKFCSLELAVCLDTGRFREGLELLPEIELELKNTRKNPHKLLEIMFYCNTALLHFHTGNYSKALNIVNAYFVYAKDDFRLDAYSFMKIFHLIIHYELGNADLLPYLVKSVHRYLSKKQVLHTRERIFLEFVRNKLPRVKSKSDQIHAFRELRTSLLEAPGQFEKDFDEDFDFISWLESKIENRPFGEIIREKIRLTGHS